MTEVHVAITIVVIAVLFLVATVVRITVKIQSVRHAPFLNHTCPEHVCPTPLPEIQVVERNHNPWTPVPWKVVKS